MRYAIRSFTLLSSLASLASFIGCGIGPAATTVPTASIQQATSGAPIQGKLFGGRQPVGNAHIYLFAAGTGGSAGPGIDASTLNASVSLLNASLTGNSDSIGAYVLTDSGGNFSISTDYVCVPGTQVYIYTLGGDPGAGTNSHASFLAVLGNCPATKTLAAQVPTVIVNEVSTIAAAYAFAAYTTDAIHVSSSGSPQALIGIANAFANAANLHAIDGQAALSNTPAGNGTVPTQEINTLADILATCVNDAGPAFTNCGTLFGASKNGSITPADTANAAINIAHNPSSNVDTLYPLASPTGPFQTALGNQPNDFSITLTFTSPSINYPTGLAIDATGRAWVTSFLANNVTRFLPNGSSDLNYAFVHLLQPYGITYDNEGDLYMTAAGGPYIYEIGNPGTPAEGNGLIGPLDYVDKTYPAIDFKDDFYVAATIGPKSTLYFSFQGTNYTYDLTTLIKSPTSLVLDSNGALWMSSYSPSATGSANLVTGRTGFSGSFSNSSCTGANYTSASGMAVDHSNNIWLAENTNSYLIQFSNDCSETASYNAGGIAGRAPLGVAIDGSNNVWTTLATGNIVGLTNAGVPISGTQGYNTAISGILTGPVIDPSGNIWFTNLSNNTVNMMIGAATPVVTPLTVAATHNQLGTRP